MPGLDAKETKSLFKRIADSGETISYALGLGAKPDTSGFLVHKSKKPTALEGELKKAGGYKKVGFGSLEVRGGQVLLTERRAVSHADKLLRQLFKANGLKAFEPILVTGEGEETDDGEETARAERRTERLDKLAALQADLAALKQKLGA